MLDNTLDLLHKHNTITTISEDNISDIVNTLLSDEITKQYSNVILSDGQTTEQTSSETTTEETKTDEDDSNKNNDEENTEIKDTIDDEGATEEDKFDVDKKQKIGKSFSQWAENFGKNHPFLKRLFKNIPKAAMDIMLHGAGGADASRLFDGLGDAFWDSFKGSETKYKDYTNALQKLYNDKSQNFNKYYNKVTEYTTKGGAKVANNNLIKIINNVKSELSKNSSVTSGVVVAKADASNEPLENLKRICQSLIPSKSDINNKKIKTESEIASHIFGILDKYNNIQSLSDEDRKNIFNSIKDYLSENDRLNYLQNSKDSRFNDLKFKLKECYDKYKNNKEEVKEEQPKEQPKKENISLTVFSNLLGITHILLSNGSSAILKRGTEEQLKDLPNGNTYVKILEDICNYIDSQKEKGIDTKQTILKIATECNDNAVMAFTNLLYIILVNLSRDLSSFGNNENKNKEIDENDIIFLDNNISDTIISNDNKLKSLIELFKKNGLKCNKLNDNSGIYISNKNKKIIITNKTTNFKNAYYDDKKVDINKNLFANSGINKDKINDLVTAFNNNNIGDSFIRDIKEIIGVK